MPWFCLSAPKGRAGNELRKKEDSMLTYLIALGVLVVAVGFYGLYS